MLLRGVPHALVTDALGHLVWGARVVLAANAGAWTFVSGRHVDAVSTGTVLAGCTVMWVMCIFYRGLDPKLSAVVCAVHALVLGAHMSPHAMTAVAWTLPFVFEAAMDAAQI